MKDFGDGGVDKMGQEKLSGDTDEIGSNIEDPEIGTSDGSRYIDAVGLKIVGFKVEEVDESGLEHLLGDVGVVNEIPFEIDEVNDK